MRNLHTVLTKVLDLIPNNIPYKHHLEYIHEDAFLLAPEVAHTYWKEASDIILKYFPRDIEKMEKWQKDVINEWTKEEAAFPNWGLEKSV